MIGFDAVARPFTRVARLPLLAPLAGRDFRLVWFGESVSLLGDQFHTVALSWLVLGADRVGPGARARCCVAAAIPRGDLHARRRRPRPTGSRRGSLVLGSNVLRAVLTTIVAALVLGSRDRALAPGRRSASCSGRSTRSSTRPSTRSIPRLVPPDRLAAANAVVQGTGQLVGTVGPALAGFAIAIIGVGAAFAHRCRSRSRSPRLALWLVRGGATATVPSTLTEAADDTEATATPATATARYGRRPSSRRRPPTSHAASMTHCPDRRRPGGPRRPGDADARGHVDRRANLAFNGPIVVGLPWLVLVHFGGDALSLGLLFAA